MFYRNWQFFRKDGIHLNEMGHRKLGEILFQAYDNRMKKGDQPPQPTPIPPLTPSPSPCQESQDEYEFEGFPNE